MVSYICLIRIIYLQYIYMSCQIYNHMEEYPQYCQIIFGNQIVRQTQFLNLESNWF